MRNAAQIKTVLTGSRLEALENYFIRHSEQVFALLIIISVAAINYLIPYKLVFLNFFFIVILLGAYLSGGTQGNFVWCPHHLARHRLCLLLSQLLYGSLYRALPVAEHPGLVQFSDLVRSRIDPPFENGDTATQKASTGPAYRKREAGKVGSETGGLNNQAQHIRGPALCSP